MELTSASVLGSIDDGRYHSCLLTTYSFVPAFMQQRVVPQLRGSGIRNVLALVDGDMLAEVMERCSASGQLAHPRYGLWPIYREQGVFHPKLILCLGESHGLLALGSGNLTNGGHGANDELWSLFRFTEQEQRYAPLFAQVWQAVRTWSTGATGWASRQLEWAATHTPWLPQEFGSTPVIMTTDEDIGVRFVASPEQNALLALTVAIAGRKVKRITVLSPFMDARGTLLGELVALTDGGLRCVVDDINGAVPERLPDAVKDRITFHHWRRVQQVHEEREQCVLHAKAVVLELEGGAELCLQGSANASMAAMGGERIAPVNAEACVLLESPRGGFLRRLGLPLDEEKPVAFEDLRQSALSEPKPASERLPLRLLSIAFIEQSFTVQFDGNAPDGLLLKLRDTEDTQEHDVTVGFAHGAWQGNAEMENAPTAGALYTAAGERLSNWQVVQLHGNFLRNDPDARAQQIESLVDRLEIGDDQLLADIVPYLPVPDHEANAEQAEARTAAGTGEPLTGDSPVPVAIGNTTPYIDMSELGHRGHTFAETSTVHRVVDVLIRSLRNASDEANGEAEQEVDQNTAEGSGPALPGFAARKPQAKKVSLSAHKARKKRLLKYIRDYEASMERRLRTLAGAPNLSKVGPLPSTDDDYAHAIILCRMLMHYLLRPTIDPDAEKADAHSGIYLQLLGEHIEDNVLDVVPIAIGSFQLLAQQAVNRDRPEWTQKRFDRYREHLLADQLYCICNVEWPENTAHWFDLLVLNAMVLLDRTRPMQEQIAAAFERVISLRTGDRYQCRSFDPNVEEAWQVLSNELPNWMAVHERRIKPTPSRDIERGSYIYNSKLGICLVDAVEPYGADAAMLTLCRPGLEWNEELDDYALKHVFRSNLVLPVDPG